MPVDGNLKAMDKATFRIVLVEDQRFMAEAVEAWLLQRLNCQLAGWATSAEEGLQLCLTTQPDLALMDVGLPGVDGLELAKDLLKQLPDLRILMMSGRVDPWTIWRVQESGVHGFIEKDQSPEVWLHAIQLVVRGESFFSPAFKKTQIECQKHPEAFHKILSKRELQVLSLVASGWEESLICSHLKISPSTSGVHRKNIRQKLGLHNDRELLAYARRWGLNQAFGGKAPSPLHGGEKDLPAPARG